MEKILLAIHPEQPNGTTLEFDCFLATLTHSDLLVKTVNGPIFVAHQ